MKTGCKGTHANHTQPDTTSIDRRSESRDVNVRELSKKRIVGVNANFRLIYQRAYMLEIAPSLMVVVNKMICWDR